MQKITISLVLFALLAIITQHQASPSVVSVNFEGDFDSMNHINPTSE